MYRIHFNMLSDLCILRNIENSNMICNQNTEYFKVIVSIFYQNQMNLNKSLRTLPFCVMKVVCFQECIKAR